MNSMNHHIQQAVDLVRAANHIVVMTGAGISTPSGIPDFRSPDSGVWNNTDPMKVASIYAFRQNPQHFYDWIRPLSHRLLEAKPNSAHQALVALEKAGKVKAVITQNIDDLHSKAGSKIVYELHGHAREVTCTQCYEVIDSTKVFEKFLQDGAIPRHQCGGVLKPNIILFGEQLPVREYLLAQTAIKEADLLLIAGSSLEVAPGSDLPILAIEQGARVVIINHTATYLDREADVVIRGNVAEVLPQIVELAAA